MDDSLIGCEVPDLEEEERENIVWLVHGWMMWAAWGLLGFTMIWSNRYLKHHWRFNMIIHSVCGTIIFIFNLVFGLSAIWYLRWKINPSIHGVVGSFLCILLPLISLEGVLSRSLLKRLRW